MWHIVVALLAAAVAAEALGIVYLLVRDGEFSYRIRQPAYTNDSQAPVDHPAELDDGLLVRRRLHPFLGFVNSEGLKLTEAVAPGRLGAIVAGASEPEWIALRANNYGFFYPGDFPLAVGERDVLIAVTGGSVAQWFALQGAARLIERLREHPALRDRRLRVVNLGMGGFKQPQQLAAVSHLLALGQRFDWVICLDGFNEIALAAENVFAGIHPSMPSAHHMRALSALSVPEKLSLDHARSLADVITWQHRVERLGAQNRRSGLAAYRAATSLLQRFAEQRLAAAESRLGHEQANQSRGKLISLAEWRLAAGRGPPHSTFAELWVRSGVLLGEIAEAQGARYLHVLQPNQYYGTRSFGTEEARTALARSNGIGRLVANGYPELLRVSSRFETAGLEFFSAVSALDDDPRPMYADSCCHYTQAGNEVLADAIADHMLTMLAQ